ncbi:MAG: CHAT domain-containing protein [Geitlerinemataceae cyanobacterium]
MNAGTGNIEISGEIGQNTPLRDLTLIGNLTDPSGDPLLIQVQNFIQADSFTTQNDLTLQAGGDITIDDINTPGDVSIFSIDGDITAGRIDTGNDLADAGNIDLQAQNVTIASANLQSLNDIGGNLNIDARNGNVRITDSFTDLNGNQASISTLGGLESGTVYIFHGGGGIVPFIVGDAARNGSAAAITRGTAAAESIAFSAYPNRHTQDADRLILDTIPAPPPPAPEEPATTPDPSETTPETPTEPGEPETTSEETTSSTPSASPFDDLLDRAPSGTDPSADTSTDDASPTDTSTSTTTGEVPETESTAAPEETPTAEPDTTPPADPTSGLDTSTDPAIPDPSTSETPGGTIDPSDPDSGSDPTESSDPVTPIDPAAEDDGLIETELDLTNPIDRLIALIGETIGAETKVAIDPDTGATVASWLVEETDGLGGSDSTLITQVIPNLEPDVTVSEPVEVAATPPAVSTPDPEPIADPAPVAAAPAAAPRTATPTPVVTPAPAATPAPSSTPATPTQQDNAPVEETETPTEVTLPNLNPTIPELLTLGDGDALVEELESDFEAEFEEAADEDLNEDGDRRLTAAQIRETLQELETQTGRRGAIVYASTFCTETRGQATYDGANCLDGSEHVALALVTPGEATIVRTVQLDRQLARIVSEFQGQLTDPRQIRHHTYKQGAQKLYDILVRPIADELDSFDLDLLVYAVDAGLRQIPLAALHDGDRFLVERYSIGSIPSMGLTDTRYQRLRDSSVLAMGADEFPVTNNSALPAVPFELDAIVAESPDTAKADSTEPDAGIWPGQEFLNEDFTFANLIGQRNRAPYEIVHLATHAHFESGNPYIDLWDERKSLDEFREAEWYAPPTVELLVLSACDTARGDPEAELGFAGLAVRSGVKSVLASLWKISDLGTLSVMASFYGELGDAPLKAEAMRAAQLAMLRGEVEFAGDAIVMGDRRVPLPPEYHNTTADLSHPYYWAAFSMVGSPW